MTHFYASGGMDPVSAVINVGATIANTIAGISNEHQRLVAETAIASMSAKDQEVLAKQIAASNNANSRVNILINAVLAMQNAEADRAQKTQTIKWVLIGVMSISALGILAWYMKK